MRHAGEAIRARAPVPRSRALAPRRATIASRWLRRGGPGLAVSAALLQRKGAFVPEGGWTPETFARYGSILIHGIFTISRAKKRSATAELSRRIAVFWYDELLEAILAWANNTPPTGKRVELTGPYAQVWADAIQEVFAEKGLKVRQVIEGVTVPTAVNGHGTTAELLGMGVTPPLHRAVAEAERQRIGRLITNIDENTRELFRNTIAKSIEEGATIAETSKRLRETFPGMTRYRLQMIARTETNMAWTAGQIRSYVDSPNVTHCSVVGCEAREANSPQYRGESTCNISDVPVGDLMLLTWHPNHTGTLIPTKFSEIAPPPPLPPAPPPVKPKPIKPPPPPKPPKPPKPPPTPSQRIGRKMSKIAEALKKIQREPAFTPDELASKYMRFVRVKDEIAGAIGAGGAEWVAKNETKIIDLLEAGVRSDESSTMTGARIAKLFGHPFGSQESVNFYESGSLRGAIFSFKDHCQTVVERTRASVEAAEKLLKSQAKKAVTLPKTRQGKITFSFAANVDPVIKGNAKKGAALLEGLVDKSHISGRNVVAHELPKGEDRAYAYSQWGTIHLATITSESTCAHEFMHCVDFDNWKEWGPKHREFLLKRSPGEKTQKLSKLTGNTGYKHDEVALEDKWVERGGHVYMGKVYESGSNYGMIRRPPDNADIRSSELATMGLERLLADPLEFWTKDREYFDWLIDMLQTQKVVAPVMGVPFGGSP